MLTRDIRIRTKVNTEVGEYNDAIYVENDIEDSKANAIFKERIDKWVDSIKNPPIQKVTKDEYLIKYEEAKCEADDYLARYEEAKQRSDEYLVKYNESRTK